jgi:TRAP-type C4-dicarboxylate transport system permease small subunit
MITPAPQDRPPQRGVIELVEAIVDDTRDLVGAHVEALRDDVSDGLSSLSSTVTSSLLAFSIIIVTALLCGIALAMTLIAVGLPAWAAFWIVTAAAALLGFGLVQRARRDARTTSKAAVDVVDHVKEDVAALQQAVTDDA